MYKVVLNVVLIIIVWVIWYAYTAPDSVTIVYQNWPITLTMVFGSFIAGATSEGGGAIAFPVFTKILHMTPLDAKVFSLAIQSVGMSAATITIFLIRVPVEWRVVLLASLGGVAGVFFGAFFIAPFLKPELLKMLFTSLIVSFSLTLAWQSWKLRLYNKKLPVFFCREKIIIIFAGLIGGCMSGLVGNGIDIVCFSVMVLLFRLPEKISTATSVVLMAINSIVGFLLHLFIIGGFTEQVQNYWLSAIPVVVVGAPLGAYFCTRMNNKTVAMLLIFLISIELISSLVLIPLTEHIMSISLTVFLFFSCFFYRLSTVKRYQPKVLE